MEDVFLATTNGTVPAATSIALLNPMTGLNATLPLGSCITNVFIYRDQDVAITSGAQFTLGVDGNTTSLVNVTDNFTTTGLNNNRLYNKVITSTAGNAADIELRFTTSVQIAEGVIVFRISYINYVSE